MVSKVIKEVDCSTYFAMYCKYSNDSIFTSKHIFNVSRIDSLEACIYI